MNNLTCGPDGDGVGLRSNLTNRLRATGMLPFLVGLGSCAPPCDDRGVQTLANSLSSSPFLLDPLCPEPRLRSLSLSGKGMGSETNVLFCQGKPRRTGRWYLMSVKA